MKTNDRRVDMANFAALGLAWFTAPDDSNWNPACDLAEPKDNFINNLDLAVLATNWLEGI